MPHPGEKPLNFIRSIPADGSTNVSPLIRTITLVFDENVVAHCVWRKNQKHIQVWEGTQRLEKDKDYRIVKSPYHRHNILIKPIGRLASNTEYTIAVFPHLTSNTGEHLRKTVIIKFKTGWRRRRIPPLIEE